MNVLGAVNTRNYSQKTNFKCGTDAINLLPFYVTSLNIPDITASLPEVSGRHGVVAAMAPTALTFSPLSLEVILDEDYKIYKDIVKNFHVKLDDGTFESIFFDFWIEVTNDMGKVVMKLEFYNCLLESISELSLATNDDITEQLFSISLRYDYFEIIDRELPTLRV